jgi:hypothetical protein
MISVPTNQTLQAAGLSFALEFPFTVAESFSILSLPALEIDPNFQNPRPCFFPLELPHKNMFKDVDLRPLQLNGSRVSR